MSMIKTTLTHADRGENIRVELRHKSSFSDVLGLGLILKSQDPATHRLPTDAKGLQVVKDSLQDLEDECLCGLSGIGALLLTADPVNLDTTDMQNIGSLIKHLTQLASETKEHLETVNEQIIDSAGLITDPDQAAIHVEANREAVSIRRTQFMHYIDALALAAGKVAVRKANEREQGG